MPNLGRWSSQVGAAHVERSIRWELPNLRSAAAYRRPWAGLLITLSLGLSLIIFLADLLTPTDIMLSLIYAAPLFLCLRANRVRTFWFVVLLLTFLNFSAYTWGITPVLTMSNVTLNRFLAGAQILVVAGLLHHTYTQGQQLQRTNLLFNTILQQMPAGVVIGEAPSGRVRLVNERADTLWRDTSDPGRPAFVEGDVPLRGSVSDTTEPRDLPLTHSARTGEVLTDWQLQVLRGDGAPGIMRVNSAPVRDAAGNIVAAVMTFNDITELKEADRERQSLLESERAARLEAERANRARDEFFAMVSHDLRTPLNAILTWAHVLSSGSVDAAAKSRAIQKIALNTRLQAELIDDLLDLSRIIAGKFSIETDSVVLSTVIEQALDVVRPMAESKGIELRSTIDREACVVRGDARRLQQVVWNLTSNAIKFTPEHGVVEVHLERTGSNARIVVRDTGRGINPDFLPHVFERFQQASNQKGHGLGLGLAIVRHVVDLHGGNVCVESSGEGLGTTFTVELPLAPAPAVHTSTPAKPIKWKCSDLI